MDKQGPGRAGKLAVGNGEDKDREISLAGAGACVVNCGHEGGRARGSLDQGG